VTPRFDEVAGIENNAATCLGCAKTPEGRILLATASFGAFVVQLWDLESGRHLRTLTGHENALLDVAWGHAGDGQLLLATGSYDGTARIWDPATGQLRRTLTAGHVACDDGEQIRALACADSGRATAARHRRNRRDRGRDRADLGPCRGDRARVPARNRQ
jgi:hypothetical protein